MKLDWAIRELHRSEQELRQELLRVAERHAADHDIYYMARDLAAWSAAHVEQLAAIGRRYGLELNADDADGASVTEQLREESARLLGRRPEPALLLLRDVRQVHLKAAGVSLDWELLAQAAQGAKHLELLELAERCHPDTLRQMRWANAKLKESSTQALLA
jgi:hypothetical protein